MSYKLFLKKSIFMEIFDFFHNPSQKITPHFKWLPIKNYLSSQSDVWCILKIILLSTIKNKNKIFLVKKVGGVLGGCKYKGGGGVSPYSVVFVM